MYESFSFKRINTKNLNSIVSRICEEWETTFGQYQDIVRVADGYIQVDTELKGGNIAVVQIFAQAWIPIINCIQLLTTDTMGNKRYTMLDPTTYQLYFQGGELKIPISRFIIQDLDATPPEQYEKEEAKNKGGSSMGKTVLIINGNPKSGKTTFQNMVNDEIPSLMYSSIDPVKKFYIKYFDWDGVSKESKDRKFLSDLKTFLVEETNVIEEETKKAWENFMDSDKQIMMIDIREPSEIDKYKKLLGAQTVYIDNARTRTDNSNGSDAQVGNYEYDYVIKNNLGLEDLRLTVRDFLDYLKQNTKKYDIKKDVDVGLEEAREIIDTIEETFPSSAFYYIRKTNKKLNEHEENIKCLWKTIQRMQEEIKQQNY